jgi:Fic family protein
MISIIHENWTIVKGPTSLAAFALWRMNWIHPFVEGNGRTARAACYYLICMKHQRLLPGIKIVPERIRENRQPYYDALKAADKKWEDGKLDVTAMSTYLAGLLKGQLAEEVNNLQSQATDKTLPIRKP